MAVLTGVASLGEVRIALPSLTRDVGEAEADFALTLRLPPIADANTKSGDGDVAIAHTTIDVELEEMFGGELFEKIIVIPRKKNISGVGSQTIFPVEVWNAFLDTAKTLTAIDVTGVGGLEVQNPDGVPLVFAALQSRIFNAVLGADGEEEIANTATFAFTGISGTDMVVSGYRFVVWSAQPNWDRGMDETIERLTSVLTGYSDKEQRVSLRTIPRRGITIPILTIEALDAAAVEAALYGWQHRIYAVPWWMDMQPLLTDAAAGEMMIAVDTTYRSFEEDGLALVWRDQHTFETRRISSVSADHLTLASPLVNSWPSGGTWIVPVRRGRIPSSQAITRPTSGMNELDVTFAIEAVQ